MARIDLSQRLADLGEYLWNLHRQDRLNTDLGPVNGRMVYFAPCHQREQNIGTPYESLLGLIPDIDLERAGGAMDCCGMGGSLGFKKSFHSDSIRLGQQLADKIRAASPEALVTECLSCRLQFRHLMPELSVFHPLEILQRAYEKNNVRHEGCFVTARLKS
jgi:glycerol-3-phosphate dehydrogenase subunit C